MKRAVVFINSLSGGGAERVIATILSQLANECECYLVLMENNVDYKIDERIKILYLNEKHDIGSFKKFIRLPFAAFKLAKIIKKYNFKQITSFLYRANYVNILSNLFARHKVVISERIAPSAMYTGSSFSSKVSKFLISLYDKADLIISVSQAIKLDLIENFNITAKQVVIYNLYDLEKIHFQSNENIGINIGKKSIITVGTLCDRKNQQLILRAFASIDDKDYRLYLLGKGENESELKKLSINLGIENKTVFLGFDNNPYKYLSKCDIFVFGSNAEGFPNALVEAMACGCAVISTDCISGPREIISPYSNIKTRLNGEIELASFGILSPVQDVKSLTKAIDLMTKNDKLLKDYKQKAKERAIDFSVENIIKRYTDIICAD